MNPSVRTLRLICLSTCNLHCFYCCHEGYISRSKHIHVDRIVDFCRFLHETCGTSRVKITGGEPLLCPEIVSLVSELSSTGLFHVSLVTNGVLNGVLEEIVVRATRNLQVTISVPGISANVYNMTTGTTGFLDRVLRSIEFMTDEAELPLRANVVLTPVNVDHVLSLPFLDFSRRHKIEVRFLQCVTNPTVAAPPRYPSLKLEHVRDLMARSGFKLESETRSSCIYNLSGSRYVLIKGFCREGCTTCPDDKTSLWLAGDGQLRACVLGGFLPQRFVSWTHKEFRASLGELFGGTPAT